MSTPAAIRADLKSILPLRALFLQEINAQVRYNAVHERGWSDAYLLTLDGTTVGYGSVKGRDDLDDRDTVFEFFLIPPLRSHAGSPFRALCDASGARFIECQSNDPLLAPLLPVHATGISADVVLFADGMVTHHVVPRAVVRPRREGDRVFDHIHEPVGDFVAELDGEVVGTGGFATHYNPPFADLYMEVHPDHRRRGIGTFLIQEVKRACRLAGRVPAARCHVTNAASRATLLKAGMRGCGRMMMGTLQHRL